MHRKEADRVSIAAYGSLEDIVQRGETIETEATLPGLTLHHYIVKDVPEPWLMRKAEALLVGVAVDASAEIKVIPPGQDKLEQFQLVRKVRENQRVQYLGEGLPLVVPPTKGFLALRLLLVDSDSGSRDAAEVVKTVADAVATKEAVTLLTATGLPEAAAVAVVFGKALEAASKIMANNHDDVIETFEGYFTPASMTEPIEVVTDDVEAEFRWITA
jgi:hypothetical protein